jgi:hypothetical protein
MDLSADERKMLTTGFTRFLTKSKASQDDLLSAVDEMVQCVRVRQNENTHKEFQPGQE